MNRRILTLIVFTFLFLWVKPVSAQMGMMGGSNGDKSAIDAQVNAILKTQNVEKAKDINCNNVTNDQLEKLGDAWMDYQMGNEAMHERMDNMMGGEGSDNLKNMHIQMGKNYLGCSTNGYGVGMPMMFGYGGKSTDIRGGMMGSGGLVGGFNTFYPNNSRLFGLHLIFCAITWLALILFLLAGARYFWKNTKNIK